MQRKKFLCHATQFEPARQSKIPNKILNKNKEPLLSIIVAAMLNGSLVIVNQGIIGRGTTPAWFIPMITLFKVTFILRLTFLHTLLKLSGHNTKKDNG